MKFIVEKTVFEKLPTVCFGVVAAKGVNNAKAYPAIEEMLDESIALAFEKFNEKRVKEEADIIPYREAFAALDINPNKYMCSIEALFTRISKGKGMPHINPVVDLGNAVSLKYTLPMGAHDIGGATDDMKVRFSTDGDIFLPFGEQEAELPDAGELVYAVGNQVRTRRWTWRQSEHGKIDAASSDIFFPIDGFTDVNKGAVIAATEELYTLVKELFGCEAETGYIDAENPEMAFTIF